MPKAIDWNIYVGKKFNRLTIKSFLERRKAKPRGTRPYGECVCDCGLIIKLNLSEVVRGHTKSCGCFQKEQASIHNKTSSNISGVYSKKDITYKSFLAMKWRCNPKSSDYKKYYSKISPPLIDENFLGPDGYENFYKEVGPRPNTLLTLDRIDNNKGYLIGNLRWASRMVQSRNRGSSLK